MKPSDCEKCRNTGWLRCSNSNGLSSCNCEWSELGYLGGFD